MKYLSFIVLFLALPLSVLAQGTDFVPLTNIPAITEVGNAITTPEGLAVFLNNIYRLCIGIAGVIAVLQIMRAGIMYMGGDSVTEKKEAKNLIALSIGGLILVLSPVVVFSIINPEILSLKINKIGELQLQERLFNTVITTTNSEQECRDRGGTVENPGPPVSCRLPRTNAEGTGADQQCADFQRPGFSPIIARGNSCAFNVTGEEGFIAIASTCCAGITEGSVCCGLPNSQTGGARADITQEITYEIYQEWNSAEAKGTVRGVVPRDSARVQGYVNACTQARGTMDYGRDGNWFERFTTAAWGECDYAATQVPQSTGNANTKFQCQNRRSQCVVPQT